MVEKRLYHTVANKILELIDSGVFPPGSRLPGERDLATKFEVSRVAVREAEIALQAQGRIEIKVGSGAYVLDSGNLALNGLPKVGPFELTEARALFEAESAALAAPIISDDAIAELENYIEIMSGRVVGEMTPDEADSAFHNAIARATNNHAIMFVIESMWKMRTEAAQLQTVYKSVCDRDSSHREDEHQAIVEALKRRNSSDARSAMRAHFTRMIDALLEASEEQAYAEVKRQAAESRSRYMLTKQLDR
ncbi:uxu operon regulator [Algimonas ampicilliniresistens]|jgi:DNA-binding FadR family transcriptional regulator|uniref:Uxu operon regulator n=2 Tax=Algimonas ampicilliniresistens TaxID=1298735 RepID=A0ABQ5V7A1_9PROT|nr:uxu operon regulator [Algimonas ampicilliniresistens]